MTKLKTTTISVMCHDRKLSRNMMITWYVAVYIFLEKKIKKIKKIKKFYGLR